MKIEAQTRLKSQTKTQDPKKKTKNINFYFQKTKTHAMKGLDTRTEKEAVQNRGTVLCLDLPERQTDDSFREASTGFRFHREREIWALR